MNKGQVVWLCGLSGAGKSTICNVVADRLQSQMRHVQILDGDMLRQHLSSDLGFGMEDRFENIRRIAYIAGLLANNGLIVLVAAITPLQAMRDSVRSLIPEVIEVFVDAPIAICEGRDPKGLYRRARAGLVSNMTGFDSPFEPPISPNVLCRTNIETVQESADKVLESIIDVKEPEKPTDRRRRSIAVDFDGVIANYEGRLGKNVHDSPRYDVVSALAVLRLEGWRIIVHTTRCAEDIGQYLRKYGVPFDEVNSKSDYGSLGVGSMITVYWGDRAIRYSGDAMRDLPFIRGFRTWNGRR
jgi:adenylylsulfate kinase